MKPASDLCHHCQSFSRTLTKSGNLTEEEKEEILKQYQSHLDNVKMQRDHYRDQCAAAKTIYRQLSSEQQSRGQPPCSLDAEFHYSFDYAQQVHYPHYAQQVGPLFFKTPRKCQCFGICCEGLGTQIFYLVDEAENSNKGANTVTSLLHHHFIHHGLGEKHVQLHMDNCSGQNKNNTVIGYGMWRVMTGLHESVEFSMMEVGHTKFNPDWHFGLWKVKWRHSNVETLSEIASSVQKSSRNGHNIPQLVDDPTAPIFFYDWATFLKRVFKPIPSLKSYHHFRMNKDHPGMIFVRKYAGMPEVAVDIRKTAAVVDNSQSKGLDAQRQWYLYEEVAPYCENKESCPKPTVPKPVFKLDSSPKLVRKCSSCKLSGHTKQYCSKK